MSNRTFELLAIAGLAVCVGGCSSIDNITVHASASTVVEKGTVVDSLLGQLDFVGFDGFDIASTEEFQNQGYTKDQIDSMHIESFTLDVTDPSDGTFDFLSSIEFTISAPDEEAAFLAGLDSVPEGTSHLDLDVAGDLNLRNYATADTMTLDTNASGVRPDVDTTVSARVTFDVDINVSGAL